MKNEETVREIAANLGMLDASGSLMEMDSLTILDFVTELERKIGKTIPTIHIRRSNFESVKTVSVLLEQLNA